MYKVIKAFFDLQDKEYVYKEGDTYPRAGLKPTAKRIAELSGSKNLQGQPLIEEVKPKPKPKAEPKEKAGTAAE